MKLTKLPTILISFLALIVSIFSLYNGIKQQERILKKQLYFSIIDGFSEQYAKINSCDSSPPSKELYAAFLKFNLIENEKIKLELELRNKDYETAYIRLCTDPNITRGQRDIESQRLQTYFNHTILMMRKEIGL